MPRRSVLSAVDYENLLAVPTSKEEMLCYYTLCENDLAVIRTRRNPENRLGFAVLLCYMRYPGVVLGPDESPSAPLVKMVAKQLSIPSQAWEEYGRRPETRREHLMELQSLFGFKSFTTEDYVDAIDQLEELAKQTDRGPVLASALIKKLRTSNVLVPALTLVEQICAEAITNANRFIYHELTRSLTSAHRQSLKAMLKLREDSQVTVLTWLRQSPKKPNSRHMLEHIERLQYLQSLDLPSDIESRVHQNRILKLAREGRQMKASNLAKLERNRRLATLVALSLESTATVIDEIIDLHDRIVGKLFNKAKRKHQDHFQASGKSINNKVSLYGRIGQAIIEAKRSGDDPFAAIEAILSWESFTASVSEAQKLAQPDDFDFLHRIRESYPTFRRYAPALLDILELRAAPAALELLQAVELLKLVNKRSARGIPADAPSGFIRKRWRRLVYSNGEIDRKYYEICVLVELKNALRSGDIWVNGSRQFKDFDDYLIPVEKILDLKKAQSLPLTVTIDCEAFLHERLSLLEQELDTVNRLAASNGLPDAVIGDSGLKITPLDSGVPESAQKLIYQISAQLPRVKITDLLHEVDAWTGFTRHFTHLKTNRVAKSRIMLLTTILADAINLGVTKMAESCPGSSYDKLSWIHAWHVRDDTYSKALAELVNAQSRQSFAEHWGQGTTSSSDGQRFKVGGHAGSDGRVNPKYGTSPGRLFYTHISDQYSPFHTKVINVGVRDSTFVLDGLLYHESDLNIEEHYTDTAGFTDHVFGLMHLLGFRFAPRIRDLRDTRLYRPKSETRYEALRSMIGGVLNLKQIRLHWNEILRLATSIQQGTVTASLILRKIGGYPRQNGLALALRELGRIERTLFILDWLQSVELRRRVNAGLNKGEARNALARAVFFHRLGEIRDRSFEQQCHRASGLNLVTAAIVLWNTVYLERATDSLRKQGLLEDESLIKHLSPLGWEHIGLTGDYIWPTQERFGPQRFRALRHLDRA